MKEKKVYIVRQNGGEYEETYSDIVGIFTNRKKAIEIAEKNWDTYGNWLSKLQVPYDIYIDNAYKFEFNENAEDEDTPVTYTDYLGYTAEQWKETAIMIDEVLCHDYKYTDVIEKTLDPEDDALCEIEKQIWEKYGDEFEFPDDDDYDDDDDDEFDEL